VSDSKEKKNPWAKHLAKHSPGTPVEPGAETTASPVKPRPPEPIPPAVPAQAPANPWAKALARQAPPPSPAKKDPNPPAGNARTTARDVFRKPAAAPRADPPIASPPVPSAPAPATPANRKDQVSDELAAALSQLAVEYAPLPVTNAPFVSAKERELESRERRRSRRIWLAKRLAVAAGVLGVLLAISSLALFRFPADEALTEAAAKAAQIALARYSSSERPLQIDTAVAVLGDTFDFRHLRYFAEVTLRLREPLYGPAATNGTVAYRQLQQSLSRARQQDLDFGLFPLNEGPKPPDLPRLIQMLHRAGEPLVVRLPFEAKKFGWSWRLDPPQLPKQAPGGRVDGLPLGRFADAPYLIFGPPETIEEVRNRTMAAREYIFAVAKAVQRRGPGETIAEAPNSERTAAPAESAANPAAGLSADPDRPAIDPNAVSVPGLKQPFDPDKPAVAAEKPRKPE
jgi:hypothetical protein